MEKKKLQAILDDHAKWLNNESGGKRADLRDADLWRTNLHNACLQIALLQNTDLRRANLQDANLQYAGLQDANLQDANLRNADLQYAGLQDANLQDANLRNADLRNANLQYANLRNADLWNANLRNADLRNANLQYADLDFSCWPLWCGSLDTKVDARLARQLAYHFCRLDCDDPEYITARNAILDFANKFHRVDECGELERKE